MRRKWKIGLVLAGAAVAIGAFWLWPSQEPAYEGKRLGEWLDEGMRLVPTPYVTNQSVGHVVKAIQAIGNNAIPFLLRDMERKEPRWLQSVKRRAYDLKLMDRNRLWGERVNRSVWGFQALGTNAAPALARLLALHDGDSAVIGSAQAALGALGPYAVPELEKRLHATDIDTRGRALGTLVSCGPAAEPAIPSLLPLLDDTNRGVRQSAVLVLVVINRRPERFVPLFRGLLVDSNRMIRAYAADGLRRFGKTAEVAVPELLRAANDPDPNVSNSVRRALKQIESEASKADSR
jgi:hypothetical protein